MAALQIAADFRPDVVLLDIGLPGMNGFEVAHRLRTQPRVARRPADRADRSTAKRKAGSRSVKAVFTTKPSISSSVISVSAEAARSSTTRMRAGALVGLRACGRLWRPPPIAGCDPATPADRRSPRCPSRPFAVRLDPAAVQFHQVLDQREADAQAALRAVERLVGLREQVEMCGMNAGSMPAPSSFTDNPHLAVARTTRSP